MPPQFIYKYQPIDESGYSLKNLHEHQIYFQHPSKFDDPFDCAIQIIKEMSDDDIDQLWNAWRKGDIYPNLSYDVYSSQYQTNGKPNEKFIKAIAEPFKIVYGAEKKKMLDRWGVSCFSARNDILLMWSHYGSGHQGFCLEFDTTYSPFNKALEVSYPDTDEIPSFSHLDIFTRRVPALRPMILTKASCWKHQEEWRVFTEDGDKTQTYDSKCLTKVFFGAKSSRKDQVKIIEALGDGTTQLYIMQPDTKSFKLKPIEYAQWLGQQSDFLSS